MVGRDRNNIDLRSTLQLGRGKCPTHDAIDLQRVDPRSSKEVFQQEILFLSGNVPSSSLAVVVLDSRDALY
jgi:hypothetical protein